MSSFTQRLALLLAGSVLCGAALVAEVPAKTPAPKSAKASMVKVSKHTTVKHRRHRRHRHGRATKVVKMKTTIKAPTSLTASPKS